MKTTISEKTVEVCDFCHQEGFLTRCDVCDRQFCLIDEATVASSWGFTSLCRECVKRDDVCKVCERYAKQLTLIFKKRDAALMHLPKNEKTKIC